MRLITHNVLKSNVHGANSFPLEIEAEEVEIIESEFNEEFIKNILVKLDWNALRAGAHSLGVEDLPETYGEEERNNEEFLKKVHHVLLEIHVVSGALICPKTKRRFPINNKIPNMVLHEDEV